MPGDEQSKFVYNVKIITKPLSLKNPIIVEGFPGIGLVGNIAGQHLIDELNMEYVGSMESKYFPPIAVLFNGIINMPVRIYQSKEHNILTVISDIPIHPTISYEVSKVLVDWAQSINVKEIVSIAGIATMSSEEKVFGAATNDDMLDKIRDYVEIFQVGTISGISGSVMTECVMRDIHAISLLGETNSPNPDPRAAASVISILKIIYGLPIDTENLMDQAEQIEVELQKLAEQVKTSEEGEQPRREFPMYG
ncbi:MAG: proteasome assembly chaperone family protein [ANME-2 cluster archaeon]|nr:proteasome assembly chaperone family protein [ANME-2 cluster archaeon]MBC2700274.1 proteasome assembly chaperone family protein [ANME-2 cluster archaeon]MBC2708016.1 proteasome assembly chaperone family protein [ANME-2 cluster archaeon]MBC2747806.1 proteasome assembly chaperone family protein [ANME-2 cluster archaeon]MBC2762321.1 proteasome assembly chaperone family protein [ANME-2 cluster archaeon]